MGLLPAPSDPLGWRSPGDLPTLPEEGELVVQKVRPVDCRVVRGFVHAPVDGRPDSWGYIGAVNEYDTSQGYAGGHWQNICYELVKDPGVHVTLADDAGFNGLYLRGGFEGLIYRDVDALDGPGNGKLILDIPVNSHGEGKALAHILDHQRIVLPETVRTRRVSFFRRDNILGDAAFLRIGAAALPGAYTGAMEYRLGAPCADAGELGPDFVRLGAVNPGEQHPSTFERRFARAEDRGVMLLTTDGPGREVVLPAGRQCHFLTPPLPAGTPVGAVRFNLEIRGARPGNVLALAVQDPLIGGHELIRIDVLMTSTSRARVLLDFPDQWMAQGRRFWVTLASRDAVTLGAGSTVRLLTVKPETALAEHLAWRLFLLKGYFYVLSEARPWSGRPMNVKWLTEFDGREWYVQRMRPQLMDLYRTVEHLAEIAPEHPVVMQYHRWLTRVGKPYLDPKDVAQTAEVPGVPRWAVLMERAKRETLAIPEWWIANRLSPQGEMGGFLSDDTDMYGHWMPGVFMDPEGFGAEARRIFPVVAEGLLRRNLREGINLRATDALHAYEEGQNHMALMPLVFYGDPRWVEWCMTSARSVEKWMYRTPEGRLKFRVNNFGWETAEHPPKQPAAQVNGEAALLLHSHVTLAWYNRNAAAIQTLADWADPAAGNDLSRFGGPGVAFAAYWFTGDARYLGLPPAGGTDRNGANWWAHMRPEFITHGREAREQPWWKAYVNRVAHESVVFGDSAWAAGKDRAALCKSMEYVLYGNPDSSGGVSKYRYIWTAAEMFTDRIFLPMPALAQPMLGGYTVRNSIFPAYAVSYEGLGREFAALVLEQGRDRLKVEMVNLSPQAREGAFVVWQLDHGRYEVTAGPDGDDDGRMDAVEERRTVELGRMDRVPVRLPSRRAMVYELRQIEKLDDLCARADLAVCAEDVVREGAELKVTAHNIGSRDVADAAVAVVAADGRLIARVAGGPIRAPLDLVPKTVTVRLPAAGAAKVVLDPDNAVPEITKVNNTVAVP